METGFFSLRESVTERTSAVWLIHSQDWKWDCVQKNNLIETHKASSTHHSIQALPPRWFQTPPTRVFHGTCVNIGGTPRLGDVRKP